MNRTWHLDRKDAQDSECAEYSFYAAAKLKEFRSCTKGLASERIWPFLPQSDQAARKRKPFPRLRGQGQRLPHLPPGPGRPSSDTDISPGSSLGEITWSTHRKYKSSLTSRPASEGPLSLTPSQIPIQINYFRESVQKQGKTTCFLPETPTCFTLTSKPQ